MSASRKVQLGLGTVLLWLSTSASGFAATNIAGKFQPNPIQPPVESIPSRQLNSVQDTTLIAGEFRDMMSRIPTVRSMFYEFDAIWKNRTDRQTRLLDYCKSQKDFSLDQCHRFLQVWLMDTEEVKFESNKYEEADELAKIMRNLMDMKRATQ